jgi:uncharacterized protein
LIVSAHRAEVLTAIAEPGSSPAEAAAAEAASGRAGTVTAEMMRRLREAERRCIVRRESGPTDLLIRFVLDPEGIVTPDLAEKLPGRGVWVTADRETLQTAVAKQMFSQGLKTKAKAPDDLVERVASLLRRRCLDWLGLARRAGEAVAGHDKVRALIEERQAAVLLQASDASPDSVGKLARLADGIGGAERFDGFFPANELGQVFDRDIAVHVGVMPGGIASGLVRDMKRFSGVAGSANPVA